MNRINFLNGNTFPLDVDTLVFMQEMITTLSEISPVFGDKVIVSGCEAQGSYVGNGLVVINKELLRFEGNNVVSTVYIAEEEEDVLCQEEEFTGLYTRRCVKFGTGDGKNNFRWSDFKRLDTLPVLMQKIADIDRQKSEKVHRHAISDIMDLPDKVVPRGLIAMWSGFISNIPSGWALCNGQRVGGVQTPDLSGRFIVGYSANGEYSYIGKTGGAASVTLGIDQMPSHSHLLKDYYHSESKLDDVKQEDGYDYLGKTVCGSHATDDDNIYFFYMEHNTYSKGGSSPHENRPPYYTLAYIMKV